MSREIFFGVGNIARRIRKGYAGVSGYARILKKAYVGVDGVARLVWSAEERAINYLGTVSGLSVARSNLAAASIGYYALFGGGMTTASSNRYSAVVDFYDKNLTKGTASTLTQGRFAIRATTIGNYAVFGGGYKNGNTDAATNYANVDAYNASLTRSTATAMSLARGGYGAVTIGNYAVFAGGGQIISGGTALYGTNVDTYNASLTRSTATGLSEGRYLLAAAAVENYALFSGGLCYGSVHSASVDAYNISLTRSTAMALSVARRDLAATSIGSYALFGGGYTTSNNAIVDAYNASLTRSTATALSIASRSPAAVTIGDSAMFGGGTAVDLYNASLTRSSATKLSESRKALAATKIGNIAFFGGGDSSGTTVDVYQAV